GSVLFLYFLTIFRDIHLADCQARNSVASTSVPVAVVAFLCSASACFVLSSLYHVFECHSIHLLDYTGIIGLIVASSYPWNYYYWFCEPRYQLFYLSSVTVVGVGAAAAIASPRYSRPEHASARVLLFTSLMVINVTALVHAAIRDGFQKLCETMGVRYILCSWAFYLLGGVLYAKRFPESKAPGRFDIFGASHPLLHICVIIGAVLHYVTVLRIFHHWHPAVGLANGT
ncbi:Hly-III-like protein, partial [Punctularia strigosozonata HHB-11173 SS5]